MIIGNYIGVSRGMAGYINPTNEIADAHIARVQADGGVIESESVLRQTINALVGYYGVTDLVTFKTKLPATIDPAVFGYKVGTGALSSLGFAANKLYSINENADVTQATAAAQSLLLTHNDIDGNYVYFPRSTSTINQAIRRATGITFTPATDTLVLTAKILLGNQTASSYDFVVFSGTQWALQIKNLSANKTFRFGGSTAVSDATSYTPSATIPHWIRTTVTPTAVSYEWSADGFTWNVLNSGLTPPSFGSASTISIGNSNGRTQNAGNVYYVKVENQTTAVTVECDLNDYDSQVSQTNFVSHGSTWELDYGANTNGLKMSLVERTMIQGDGIDDIMTAPSLLINQPHTAYALIKRHGLGTLSGMSASSSISNDATNSTLNNGTALNIANASKLKQYLIAESNGVNSKIRINNGADTIGNAGANNGTYLSLFGNGAAFGNFDIYSYIISSQADSDAIKTSMNSYFNG
jgi:hypothetical protein